MLWPKNRDKAYINLTFNYRWIVPKLKEDALTRYVFVNTVPTTKQGTPGRCQSSEIVQKLQKHF